MTKIKMYKYLGYNGTIVSPVLLEGVNHISFYKLKADDGKVLSNGSKRAYVISVNEEDIDNWTEIDIGQE
jgi:hypothetical protein